MAGRNGGSWDKPGIVSTAAKNKPLPKNTGLGAITGQQFLSVLGNTTFDGRSVANTDVLVKYTYYGDTDFSGKVDFDDYALIDAGYQSQFGARTHAIHVFAKPSQPATAPSFADARLMTSVFAESLMSAAMGGQDSERQSALSGLLD